LRPERLELLAVRRRRRRRRKKKKKTFLQCPWLQYREFLCIINLYDKQLDSFLTPCPS
jgi:hypothetical protein